MLSVLTGCGKSGSVSKKNIPAEETAESKKITLSDSGITVDGAAISDDETAAVYAAQDIVYYEEGQGVAYGAGTDADAHSQEEADAHTVVHITQPGTYTLSGTLSAGQIAVDLGDGAEEDPEAVVTIVLDGVDITCTVAPAIIFYRVYECGSADMETATQTVDTSAAGANVVIADGTENRVTGSHVAKIYKPESVTPNADGTAVEEAKKLHKYDGALYSKMSMNVSGGEAGTGTLEIVADNEGLDSELHLTINSGNIHILAGNDGINTNEDGVSVTTINGGTDIAIYGTTASTGEAGRILMRYAPGIAEYGAVNWTGPEAEDYAELLNTALATIDADARNTMYHTCQELLMENFVCYPIWHKEINAALQLDVQGFHLMPTYENHYLQYVYFG